ASVNVAALQPTKSVVSTSAAHTSGTDVAIGEVVRYRVAVTVPEGVNSSFAISDDLPGFVALDLSGAVPGNATVAMYGTELSVETDFAGALSATVCDLDDAVTQAPFPADRITT